MSTAAARQRDGKIMLMVEVGEVALTEALLAATEIVLDQAEAAYDFVNASGSCGVLSC